MENNQTAVKPELPGDIYHRYNCLRTLFADALMEWESQLTELNADDDFWIAGPEKFDGAFNWLAEAKRNTT